MSRSTPPSRDSNPFATCWTRPGALPFEATNAGLSPSVMVDRLAKAGWRGQVVGSHGSGKSTLLRSLANLIERAGSEERCGCVRAIDATMLGDYDYDYDLLLDQKSSEDLLFIEGFERLVFLQRTAWLHRLRASKARFVLTTHRPLRGWRAPAVVARLAPDAAMLGMLFAKLVETRPTPVTLEMARRTYCLQRGNLRAVWFDLYNLHETLTRTERTAPVAASYALPAAAS